MKKIFTAIALLAGLGGSYLSYANQNGTDYIQYSETITSDAPTQINADTYQVAVILPESGNFASASKAIRSGLMAAYYTQDKQTTTQSIQVYNSDEAPVIETYEKAIREGASLVIGPLNKPAVATLADASVSLPTLALNFTDVVPHSALFYQFALSPQDEATQTADKASADGHTRALIIAPASAWGKSVSDAFQQRWIAQGGSVADSFYFTTQTSLDLGIKRILQLTQPTDSKILPQHRSDADMVFLIAEPTMARQIKPLLNFYYANDLPVYATSLVYDGQVNAIADKDLDGIKFCDLPFMLSTSSSINQAMQQMQQLLPETSSQNKRLFAFGYDAYHLAQIMTSLGKTPTEGYEGLTGTLYMGDNQQILRRLPWAEFVNGLPKRLN